VNEHIYNSEQYPLEIKSTMDKAEERLARKVMSTFSTWNYAVLQWAVGIIQDFKKQNEKLEKSDEKKLIPTKGKIKKELINILTIEDFLIDNDLLAGAMEGAVGYTFDQLAIRAGSKSMATAILASMNVSFNIKYDMARYNKILADRKEWLAEKLYDTTIEGIPEIISEGIRTGATIDDMTESIQNLIGIDKERAEKIARTETNNAINEAIRQQTHELGITKYRISDAVDACEICMEAAQREYTYEQISGLLPLHPNCRCVLQSVIPSSWMSVKKSLHERGLEKTISKGYIPIKGIDYFTDEETQEFKKEITPVRGKDYLTPKELQKVKEEISPKKGVDYLVKKEIEKIKKEVTPIKGIDYKDGENGRKGKTGEKGEDGKDGSPDTPKEIKGKLESLKGEDRLDAKAIKNLDKQLETRIPEIVMTGMGGEEISKVKVDNTGDSGYLLDKLKAGTNVTIQKDGDKVKINSTGGTGTTAHSDLTELDYVSSGHTGFQPAGSYLTSETDPVYSADKSSIALKSEIPADVSELTDTTGLLGNATASDVTFTPGGDIASVNVQDAIIELDGEKSSKSFAIAMAVALG